MGTIRIKIQAQVDIEFLHDPPHGVTGVSSKQVRKGPNMPADVIVNFTPDVDPHVVQSVTSFQVNGNPVGDVQNGPQGAQSNYSTIPNAPALNVGDQVSGFIVTTDDQSQNSPQVPFPAVTITGFQPPPGGVTNVTSRQSGMPGNPPDVPNFPGMPPAIPKSGKSPDKK